MREVAARIGSWRGGGREPETSGTRDVVAWRQARHGGGGSVDMRLVGWTAVALAAFAGNSLLTRMGVGPGGVEPAGFAVVRLFAGAVTLALVVGSRAAATGGALWPGWAGRAAGVAGLLVYLFAFSAAYAHIAAGPGALLLFGAVQIAMFAGARLAGEAVPGRRWAGAALAFAGLVVLVAPGGAGVAWMPVAAMIVAGTGWAVFSLAARGVPDALGATAANFVIAALVVAVPALWLWPRGAPASGLALAALSGSVTSGLGYAVWYRVVPALGAARAGVAQLTVPLITGAGGALLLGEPLGWRFALAAALVLGGVGWAARGADRGWTGAGGCALLACMERDEPPLIEPRAARLPAARATAARPASPRLAVRALILHEDRLLLVNAYPGNTSDLWCAPGGGVERGAGLPDNLMREVREETGLEIAVGEPALVNEFHDPARGFHQVEVFFRCTVLTGILDPAWRDPEGVVTERRFFARGEMAGIRSRPGSLAKAAWGEGILYDPLELIVP